MGRLTPIVSICNVIPAKPAPECLSGGGRWTRRQCSKDSYPPICLEIVRWRTNRCHAAAGYSGAIAPRRPRPMIAVIFEVTPNAGQRQTYLDMAAALRPMLERIDGFDSIERFESLTTPGKILSLSFWRDEEAVRRWRTRSEERRV